MAVFEVSTPTTTMAGMMRRLGSSRSGHILARGNGDTNGNSGYASLLAHSTETSDDAAAMPLFAKEPSPAGSPSPTFPTSFASLQLSPGGTPSEPAIIVTDVHAVSHRARLATQDAEERRISSGPFSDGSDVEGDGRREGQYIASSASSMSEQEERSSSLKNGKPKKGGARPATAKRMTMSFGGFGLPGFNRDGKPQKLVRQSNGSGNGDGKAKKEDSRKVRETSKLHMPRLRSAKPASTGRAYEQAETVLRLISGLDDKNGQPIPIDDRARRARPRESKRGFSATAPTKPEGKAEPRTVPQVSPKQLKQLKSSLADPKKAPQIISALKCIPIDPAHKASPNASLTPARIACLQCDDEAAPPGQHAHSSVQGPANGEGKEGTISGDQLLSEKLGALQAASDGFPTPGKLLGQLASSTGALNALAGVSARMVDATGSHDGMLTPPDDRMSVFIYWWGYEIVLPPTTIKYLSGAHSVAGTLFTFLQALAITGGIPELAPFIRYLSTYIDMEWRAIQAQDHGAGVVMAATWVLPVAVVPRPYDL